jgi:hypothetical protein
MNTIILVIAGILFINTNAYAYLDPGSSSIILQALLAAIAASITFLSVYWQKLKVFFSECVKFFKKRKKKDK